MEDAGEAGSTDSMYARPVYFPQEESIYEVTGSPDSEKSESETKSEKNETEIHRHVRSLQGRRQKFPWFRFCTCLSLIVLYALVVVLFILVVFSFFKPAEILVESNNSENNTAVNSTCQCENSTYLVQDLRVEVLYLFRNLTEEIANVKMNISSDLITRVITTEIINSSVDSSQITSLQNRLTALNQSFTEHVQSIHSKVNLKSEDLQIQLLAHNQSLNNIRETIKGVKNNLTGYYEKCQEEILKLQEEQAAASAERDLLTERVNMNARGISDFETAKKEQQEMLDNHTSQISVLESRVGDVENSGTKLGPGVLVAMAMAIVAVGTVM